MTVELIAVKIGDTLTPAGEIDREALRSLKCGQPVRVSVVRQSARSLKFHKLYFGGLVRLVADYWESDDGLISKYDKQVMSGLVRWIVENEGDSEPIQRVIDIYLNERAERIKNRLQQHESAAATLQQVHEWLKLEAGFYDAVLTPTGVIKRTKSISFYAMKTDEEFKEFYRRVFSVAWKYVLSKAQFESEEHAQNVALEMSRLA